jgi:hypothetical protein
MINIKCVISVEDLEIVREELPKFVADGINMILVSKKPDGDPTDGLFEVEFLVEQMNHFWGLAKNVGTIRYYNRLKNS